MTDAEIRKGIRRFLRGQDGGSFSNQWLEQTGEKGRDALLHLRSLPSTPARKRALIEFLLVAFFFSPELETQFLEEIRRHPDPRVQRQDEQVLRGMIASRDATRASLLAATAHRA